ncbi:hypothetical protein [Flavobacterium sp.]|uniref:hypothetical protein n=1 Tax=Flavobacterium sp. TaxID=239 RepID=UPI0037503138
MTPVISTKAPLLTVSQTTEFVKDIDEVFKLADLIKLKEVLSKYNLRDKDAEDIVIRGRYVFSLFNNKEKRIRVLNAESRFTKCVFCEFGKTVKAYDVEYEQLVGEIAVIYTGSFAIFFEIENGILKQYGFCNGYLSKNEMEELSKS